jgi:hypothetical protein
VFLPYLVLLILSSPATPFDEVALPPQLPGKHDSNAETEKINSRIPT